MTHMSGRSSHCLLLEVIMQKQRGLRKETVRMNDILITLNTLNGMLEL
jgi:hypothetical protein